MALLSIIVPVYNIKDYLTACVESICAQSFSDWELILVDDGSQDGSGALCDGLAETDSRIRVIHQANGGVSRARNAGICASRGKYLAFVDGDDYIHPEMYEKLIFPMEQGVDVAFCRFARSFPTETIPHVECNLPALAQRPWDYSKIIYEYHYRHTQEQTETDTVFGSVWRSLFRADVIRENQLRFPEDVKIAEDRLFLMEYLAFCENGYLVDEYLYYYRADRTDSATTEGCTGYQANFFQRKKDLLLREFAIIQKNPKLTKTQKKDLITYEKYRFAFDVVINELTSSDYHKKINGLFSEDLLKTAIGISALAHMIKSGTSIKRIVLYGLIRLRWWGIIARLLDSRRRPV